MWGESLCQLTICTMDSCPTEARMTRTWETDPQDEKEVSSCRYELPTPRASGAEALQNAAHCQTKSPDTWSQPIFCRQKTQHRAVFIACNSWEVTLLLSCFQCWQLPRSLFPPTVFLPPSVLPAFDHRVPSTLVSFLLIPSLLVKISLPVLQGRHLLREALQEVLPSSPV